MGLDPIPPPTGDRFATPTKDDYSASIWIATVLSISYAFFTYGVRLAIKYKVNGLDDVVLGLGHVFGLGQWIAILTALSNGLGKNLSLISSEEASRIADSIFASRILLYVGLSLSKMCLLIFSRQLFSVDMKMAYKTCTLTLPVIAVWAIAAMIAVSVGCSPDHVLVEQKSAHCANDVARLIGVTIFDMLLEITIVAIPMYFIWLLQMDTKRKVLVMIAFCFRLPNIIFSAFYLASYTSFIQSPTRGVNLTAPIIWQQVVISYSFMSATIPCLKGFVKSFTTGGMGYTTDPNRNYGTGTGSGVSGNSYQMGSMKSSAGRPSTDKRPKNGHGSSLSFSRMRLRPEQTEYNVSVFRYDAGRERDGSVNSGESQQMIIRRDIDFDVHHD